MGMERLSSALTETGVQARTRHVSEWESLHVAEAKLFRDEIVLTVGRKSRHRDEWADSRMPLTPAEAIHLGRRLIALGEAATGESPAVSTAP